jgi:hypothetical protein
MAKVRNKGNASTEAAFIGLLPDPVRGWMLLARLSGLPKKSSPDTSDFLAGED